MRYIVVGAGAVGGTIGARLAQHGADVVLVARGRHLEVLQREGLRLVTASGSRTVRVPAVDTPAALGELQRDDVIVCAVKSHDTAAVVEQWAGASVAGNTTAAETLPIVCAQNGVTNERTALQLFQRVYGLCVWLPALHLEPGVVVSRAAPLSGILTISRYPHGIDTVAERIAADLSRSDFDAPIVSDVMRWKYGKLVVNLGNAVQALLGEQASSSAADELVRACQAEGRAVLDAAAIAYTTDTERRAVEGDRMRVQPIVGVSGGSSTWQSLARESGTSEVDYLNGEIVLLGRLHGVPTPVNTMLQRTVAQFARQRRQPGAITADELKALLPQPFPKSTPPEHKS
ncbi:2-dehydropantoate 2-reductase [Nocardia transvalensis]|uniref:2-dehydropantoate 2-reductase n=1 Tax=Nocardia transvalensis TaxID=37333 RepID=A0A7W9PJ30_9NOCA|nr:ketopantoate reductase family protein [Nocardia transvalensis]MBB5916633.1 2-dehydropantoate 2-reductase [Nocardia transvalensis]